MNMKNLLTVLLCVGVLLGSAQPAFAQFRDEHGSDVSTPGTVAGTDIYITLVQLSLSANDMPSDFQIAENGWLDFFDLAHPLNSLLLLNLGVCSTSNSSSDRFGSCPFRTPYVLGVSGLSPRAKAFIGNYLYSFSTRREAEEVFERISKSWDTITSVTSIWQRAGVGEVPAANQTSRTLMLRGESGDVVYWYMVLRENNIALLLVHGINIESSADIFASLATLLSQKSPTNGPIHKIFLPAVSALGGQEIQSSAINNSAWLTSYAVGVAFWGWYPHYAAKFTGHNGRYQYYTGPSGTPPGFSSWTWYNDYTRNQLLLDTTWRITHLPESHNASYYHALLDCPC